MAEYTTPAAPADPTAQGGGSGYDGDDAAKRARDAAASAYQPSERDRKVVANIDRKYTDWRRDRQNHEPEWFINAAMFRGNHDVHWSTADNRLIPIPTINPNRSRRKINRLFAKVRARRAKFLKNRPTWVVVAATTDMKDKLDARYTGKVLDYLWRKLQLEGKYRDAVIWAEQCGRGYWWFNWNPDAIGRVVQTAPQSPSMTPSMGGDPFGAGGGEDLFGGQMPPDMFASPGATGDVDPFGGDPSMAPPPDMGMDPAMAPPVEPPMAPPMSAQPPMPPDLSAPGAGSAMPADIFGSDPSGEMGGPAPSPLSNSSKKISEAVVGEVVVECGSTYEVLVGNPGASSLRYVDELMRIKERTLDHIRTQYPKRGHLVVAEPSGDAFQYEAQIGTMNAASGMFGSGSSDTSDRRRDMDGNPSTAVVKEYFRRPTGDLPKGKYCVVANGVLLKEEDELPFGFHDMENPFPCVEFVDVPSPGQYWSTTVLAQLVDLQREYNGIRTMVSTQLKMMGHPKIFVAKQHQLPEGAWTPDAGEIIEYNARPGIKEPFTWTPPNIASDAWRMIELIRTEFDDIPQIYPVSEGKNSGANSGYQTGLLQEATDATHAPDVRSMELAVEEAAYKIRRIVKRGYDIPRLISVTSGSYEPEVFEFSAEDVDEYADIIVQAGSALPTLKHQRIQMALDLYAKGVLGDPMDPNVRRRVLQTVDLGGLDEIIDYNRVDEEMINVENSAAEDGIPLPKPRFYENHQIHWIGHINRLKSPAVMSWPTEARMGLLSHAILHAMYINHASAYQMSIEAGLEGLVPAPMVLASPMGPDGQPVGGGLPGSPMGGAPGGEGSSGTGKAGPNPSQGFQEYAPAGGAPQSTAAGPNPNSN